MPSPVLPHEVWRQILVPLISDRHLPAILCSQVCRAWQYASEEITFRRLNLSEERLARLNEIVNPRRRRYVRSIALGIALPRYGPRDLNFVESEENQRANNAAVTRMLRCLVYALHNWTPELTHPDGIRLVLSVGSPSESWEENLQLQRQWYKLKDAPETPNGRWLAEGRWASSVLEFSADRDGWPDVTAVSSLKVGGESEKCRNWSGSLVCSLWSHLPRLRCIDIRFGDYATKDKTTQRRLYNDFATSLAKIASTHAVIMDSIIINNSMAASGRRPPRPTTVWSSLGTNEEDPMTAALRELSQRCKRFHASPFVLGASFFVPAQNHISAIHPSSPRRDDAVSQPALWWPHLEYLTLQMDHVDTRNRPFIRVSSPAVFSPSPPVVDDDDDDRAHRHGGGAHQTERRRRPPIRPSDLRPTPALEHLFLAAGGQLRRMPRLRRLVLRVGRGRFGQVFILSFTRGDRHGNNKKNNSRSSSSSSKKGGEYGGDDDDRWVRNPDRLWWRAPPSSGRRSPLKSGEEEEDKTAGLSPAVVECWTAAAVAETAGRVLDFVVERRWDSVEVVKEEKEEEEEGSESGSGSEGTVDSDEEDEEEAIEWEEETDEDEDTIKK